MMRTNMVRNTSDSSVKRSENCFKRRNTTRVSRSVSGNENVDDDDDKDDDGDEVEADDEADVDGGGA